MTYGVANKILRVNLTNRTLRIDEPDDTFYRTYVGGAGLLGYYLLKEVPRGADPLGPENVLVFALGPMTGTGMPGAPRNSVGAKSPASGGFGKSEVGGFFGHELKRADFDAIVIEGRADSPVYLWVHDGEAEIRDASHLWGRDVIETHDAINTELGQRFVRTAIIGPAGENLGIVSCIMNDIRAAAGRGGMGAVMGSKNLKAVAAKGSKSPNLFNPERIRELSKYMNTNYMNLGNGRVMHDYGTGFAVAAYNEVGNLPVNNWRDGYLPGAEKITAEAVKNEVRVAMEACPGCQVRCKKVVEFEEPYHVNRRAGGPEYETLAGFGSICGITDLKAVCKANELCSLYGLDSIATGTTIAFAMECFENEIITSRDTGGIDLRFGNADAMLKAIDLIAHRQGIGEVLALGSRKAAQAIGGGAEEFSMQVKGVEFGMHEPRLAHGRGLSYCINPHGADHMTAFMDNSYTSEGPALQALRSLGVNAGPLPANDLSPAKVAMVKPTHLSRIFGDVALSCHLTPWTIQDQVEIIRAATGWEFTLAEAMVVAERVVTMGRAFNLREGLSADDDQLPKRFFTPRHGGNLHDSVDPEALRNATHVFYAMMGWDRETGAPTPEKLAELGLSWVEDHLAPLAAV